MKEGSTEDGSNDAVPGPGESEFLTIQEKFKHASVTATRRPLVVLKEDLDKTDPFHKFKEKSFKRSHAFLTLAFVWFLVLQVVGLYFFTKGFLLTKLVLDFKSECAVSPDGSNFYQPGDPNNGCWHPKAFEKAVVIVIDALRYDFTIPVRTDTPAPYQNALKVLHETAAGHPSNAFLLPFIADPPTTTLQRLKGLTTGTLPTFVDAGSNFAGTEVDEDNIIAQLRTAGKTLAHLGDDTWSALFPNLFEPEITHAYESFNVWDLHTLDNGVTEHLFPLLSPANSSKWDVIFGHFLGVDHAGHRYGPSHPAMTAKLEQMDGLIRRMIASIDDSTLLVVMGDHGMDTKGDHGGESDDEVEAALWMYSKAPRFGRTSHLTLKPPSTAKERPVNQIDLVSTLSLLLGIPIPFNNLGSPIEEAFIGDSGHNWENLARASHLTSAQIRRYQDRYTEARNMDSSASSLPTEAWKKLQNVWVKVTRKSTQAEWKQSYFSSSKFQKINLEVCKALWARFDVPSMIQGIVVLLWTTVVLASYARSTLGDRSQLAYSLFRNGFAVGVLGGSTAAVASYLYLDGQILNNVLFGAAIFGLVGTTFAIHPRQLGALPASFWGWLTFVVTISQAGGFAANSFTIWEDEILLFFIVTIGTATLVMSAQQKSYAKRTHGMMQSFTFMFLTRFASLSRLCREEQMPYCKSTYYGTSSSSTSSQYLLLVPFAVAYILPKLIQSYFEAAGSWRGTAPLVIGSFFRGSLVLSALFWLLDTAADNDQLPLPEGISKDIRMTIARIILLGAIGPGIFILFVRSEPCIASLEDPSPTPQTPPKTYIFGSPSSRGAHYFLLLTFLALISIFVQKPMGGGALALFVFQILSLLEILSTNNLSSSSLGPITLGLLGNFYFFKTGHQATLSSIQWETAFVATRTVVYPWSPLFVMVNTFGAQILATLAVPLVVLWRQPPNKKGMLSQVAKALATFMLFHAVLSLATTLWAYWLRRHLMLYRIFNPRFLTAGLVLLVTECVLVLVVLPGLRCNFLKVGRVFGFVQQ
ncbi:MAG: mannose-ethanolamine phosphotransferase gpi13 [Vezdaea aestivalis]|nr:MAG: mannose-ethanolamine phosphotransferase gpi13 [Vezdaea aestivalis]